MNLVINIRNFQISKSLTFFHLHNFRENPTLFVFSIPIFFPLQVPFVVILAGPHQPIHELFKSYQGLSSRFPLTFKCPNYTDEELVDIYCKLLAAQPIQFANGDPKHARVLIKRLRKQRGMPPPPPVPQRN